MLRQRRSAPAPDSEVTEQADLTMPDSAPLETPSRGEKPPKWWRRIAFWRAVAGMAAAAALAALIVLAEFSQLMIHRTHYFVDRLRAANETVRQLKRRVSSAEKRNATATENASTDELLKRVVSAPDLRTIKLTDASARSKSDGSAPPASGTLAVSDSQKLAVLQVAGIPSAAEGTVYRVWWEEKRGSETLAVEFMTDKAGKATVPMQPPPRNASTVVITSETGTGAAKPSGPVVLKGKITAEQSR